MNKSPRKSRIGAIATILSLLLAFIGITDVKIETGLVVNLRPWVDNLIPVGALFSHISTPAPTFIFMSKPTSTPTRKPTSTPKMKYLVIEDCKIGNYETGKKLPYLALWVKNVSDSTIIYSQFRFTSSKGTGTYIDYGDYYAEESVGHGIKPGETREWYWELDTLDLSGAVSINVYASYVKLENNQKRFLSETTEITIPLEMRKR